MSTGTLFSGMIFGAIGMGYLVYGKKQHDWVTLLVGCLLCGLPYLIFNFWLLLLACAAAMALPFFIES